MLHGIVRVFGLFRPTSKGQVISERIRIPKIAKSRRVACFTYLFDAIIL